MAERAARVGSKRRPFCRKNMVARLKRIFPMANPERRVVKARLRTAAIFPRISHLLLIKMAFIFFNPASMP
jgi:hypothetical protein